MSTRIVFQTRRFVPDTTITVRCEPRWYEDIQGVYNYVAGEWVFTVDRGNPFQFKFVRNFGEWQNGGNLTAGNPVNTYVEGVEFGNPALPDPESGAVSNTFFRPSLSDEHYDVIVVGSGVGGGILAEQLVDLKAGQTVLVLELGSYLFPSHVSNLPRQHILGAQVIKHVWQLFFSGNFRSTPYVNEADSLYRGGLGYNLGGRSIFWGGFAPTMREYEFEKGAWPDVVKDEMLNNFFEKSRTLMKVGKPRDSEFQNKAKTYIANLLGDTNYNAFDADMAVQRQTSDLRTFSTGMFSTADLLFEQRATDIGNMNDRSNLTVNLNHDVRTVNIDGGRVSSVTAYDRLSRRMRNYHADSYVLCAGALESPRIALKSGVPDSSGKIGRGLTDHKIWFVHFLLDKNAGSELFSADASAKIVIQHENPTTTQFGWNAILELGADWNQGRYVDPELMQQHIDSKGGNNIMICELVFLTASELLEDNYIQAADTEDGRPMRVFMKKAERANQMFGEINNVKNMILHSINAQPIAGRNLDLIEADIGGVAHEVGSLRMGDSRETSVVNPDLKFWDVDNLYACDLSVFPTSPSANPTLALGALALRLAEKLSSS